MPTPIAIKSFGTDLDSGLEKQLQITSLFCDAENEQILIQFKIVLLAPTGKTFSVIRTGSYIRNGIKFQDLRSSQLGQGITNLIVDDLSSIISYDSLDNDLKQID